MASDVGEAFGDLLRRQRRAAGLTQEELAARAGLSARGIADLERGARRTPRRDTVALLARALDMSPEDEAALFTAARRPSMPFAGAASPANGEPRQSMPPQAFHNLPAQATPLLGRDESVRAVVALMLRADVRLVTLTGPGGIGKTRMAIQAGAELLDDFADGVWFVRLSRLSDPNLVIPTIAETLGLTETAGQPLAETLRRSLRERRVVVVLDNCEHVAAAMPGVADLLEGCPALKVLATSRAALHLRGEHEYPVPALDVPPVLSGSGTSSNAARAPELLMAFPAVALFAERARAARPDFALTATNASEVAAICARLDGLPLAIELAAARIKVLPASAMLARLEHGLGLLVGGARDLAERQQAMRSTLAWSENLLAANEQVLFRRLAVFAGGCSLEAAEAICAAPEGAKPLGGAVLDGLVALVDQSLVRQREEGGEPRFWMLHVIREYALERLEVSGEADALRRAYAATMVELAERAEPELTGPEQGAWLDRLELEHDNLRAALGWAGERGEVETGLRLVAAIFRFWMVRGHLREGRAWAESLLALESQTPSAGAQRVRARALRAAGVLALYQRDEAAAEVRLDEAVTLGRAAGDRWTAAGALSSLGVAAMQQRDLVRAAARHEESLALMRDLGEPRGIAVALVNLGIVVYLQNDLGRAADTFNEARALAHEVGDGDLIATTVSNLASVALRRGDVAQGEALGREALTLYWELGDPRRCAVGLEGLACSGGMMGRAERAARLLGAAAALREALGTPLPANEQSDIEQAVAAARTVLGEDAWAAAFAAGQALLLEQAVAEALSPGG